MGKTHEQMLEDLYPKVSGALPNSVMEGAQRSGIKTAANMQRRIYHWGLPQREAAFGTYFRFMPVDQTLTRVSTDETWRRRRTMNRDPRSGR
jgi:hypothetical protein